MGGGVKECLGCLCGVTISVSGSGHRFHLIAMVSSRQTTPLGNVARQLQSRRLSLHPPHLHFFRRLRLNAIPMLLLSCGLETLMAIITLAILRLSLTQVGMVTTSTSAANGVMFDISGSGTPMLLGWTTPGSGDAFLALPRPDGMVVNGTQLFGNFTPQPPSDRPNGYTALAVYDQPDHGGNGTE